jgi:hypothetical protein
MDGVIAAVFDAGLNREVTANRALLPQINCSVVHERQLHRRQQLQDTYAEPH